MIKNVYGEELSSITFKMVTHDALILLISKNLHGLQLLMFIENRTLWRI